MILKSIELKGFKSFADKTKLDFSEGVTAIVGPNGCGKSNIVDAVRWVLGETSVKHLRGNDMTDVIFNGTEVRKPVSIAEVDLYFSDCENSLNLPFNELRVTRRVFRDGKSQYLLNNKIIRLKDILNIFSNTGIGQLAYSIMEQGKVDMILSAKPEDRRKVLEEAAGISKFKRERKEALRKLEYTENNLLRLEDILSENQRQVNSTKRQANKARRYKKLSLELESFETHLYFEIFEELSAQMGELKNSIKSYKISLDEKSTENEKLENNIIELKANINQLSEELEDLNAKISDNQKQHHLSKTQIKFNNERENEIKQLIAQIEQEFEQNDERFDLENKKLENARKSMGQADGFIKYHRTNLEEEKKVLTKISAERKEIIQKLEVFLETRQKNKNGLFSLENDFKFNENKIASEDENYKKNQKKINLLEKTHKELVNKLSKSQEKFTQIQENLAQLEIETKNLTKETKLDEQKLKETKAEIEKIELIFSENKSKINFLSDLLDYSEELGSGALKINQILAKKIKTQILGRVIQIDEEFIPALESVLGNRLEAIYLKKSRDVLEILTKNEHKNDGILLCEDLLNIVPMEETSQSAPEGCIDWLIFKLRAPRDFHLVFAHILANVALVEDLKTAIELKKQNPQTVFVAKNGDYVDYQGLIHIVGEKKRKSMLRYQNSLYKLQKNNVKIENQLIKKREIFHNFQKNISKKHEQIEKKINEIQEKKLANSELKAKCTIIENNLSNNKKQKQEIQKYLTNYIKNRAELEELSKNYKEKIIREKEKIKKLNAQIKNFDENVKRIQLEEQQKQNSLAKLQSELLIHEKSQFAFQNQINSLITRTDRKSVV